MPSEDKRGRWKRVQTSLDASAVKTKSKVSIVFWLPITVRAKMVALKFRYVYYMCTMSEIIMW